MTRSIRFLVAFGALGAGCNVDVPSPSSLWAPVTTPEAPDAAALGPSFPIPASCHVEPGSVTPPARMDVPSGQFAMGCDAKQDDECRADEAPEHYVQVDDFSIDETEVTQDEYAICVQAGKCTAPYCAWNPCTTPKRPITCVYRAQAVAFCSFVGEALPTEAQWEKAARGTDGRKFPWGDAPATCALAQMNGCGTGALDVGSLPAGASPYGALDMAGNVTEWTFDYYAADYYAKGPSSNPTGPTTGDEYVGRGGGWQSEEVWQRAGARDEYQPDYVKETMGFRCAWTGP
jgi:formylglycine-generating enzyme required for sulfatase activity